MEIQPTLMYFYCTSLLGVQSPSISRPTLEKCIYFLSFTYNNYWIWMFISSPTTFLSMQFIFQFIHYMLSADFQVDSSIGLSDHSIRFSFLYFKTLFWLLILHSFNCFLHSLWHLRRDFSFPFGIHKIQLNGS